MCDIMIIRTKFFSVYPRKYKDNIRFINGSFYLLQPLANFTDFREHADFEITVVLQVLNNFIKHFLFCNSDYDQFQIINMILSFIL